jgi:hypothetical protein
MCWKKNNQWFGSESAWIRIDFGRLDGSGSRRAEMTHKNRKREENLSFDVLAVFI